MGLKILGKVGTLIFFYFFFLTKNHFMHFERHIAFQNAYNYIFCPEYLKKKQVSPVNLGRAGLP